MKNVVSRRCEGCGLFQVKKELCIYCREDSPAYQKTREKAVYDLLQSTQDLRNFIHNKSVGFVCGNFRPDFLYDLGTHRIIVECDEGQHRGYEPECERIRMLNILNADLTPCVFIRYNPDAFKIGDKTRRISKDKRQAILLETIREHLRPPDSESIDVIYLFYDGAEIRRMMLTEDY